VSWFNHAVNPYLPCQSIRVLPFAAHLGESHFLGRRVLLFASNARGKPLPFNTISSPFISLGSLRRFCC
jgi:hypothetical protein